MKSHRIVMFMIIVNGLLSSGCVWETYSGGRDTAIGVDAESGYVVVTRTDITLEQAMTQAQIVLEGWAPLDRSSTQRRLVTQWKAVRDKRGSG